MDRISVTNKKKQKLQPNALLVCMFHYMQQNILMMGT